MNLQFGDIQETALIPLHERPEEYAAQLDRHMR